MKHLHLSGLLYLLAHHLSFGKDPGADSQFTSIYHHEDNFPSSPFSHCQPHHTNTTSSLPHSSIHPSHRSTNTHLISYINPSPPPPLSNHSYVNQEMALHGKYQVLNNSSISPRSYFRIFVLSTQARSKERKRGEGSGQCTPHPP